MKTTSKKIKMKTITKKTKKQKNKKKKNKKKKKRFIVRISGKTEGKKAVNLV